jgi:hypothetical protein
MNKSIIIAILLLFTLFLGCIDTNGNGNGNGDLNETEGELNLTNETENNQTISDALIIVGPCNGTVLIDVDICLMEHEMCDKIKTSELRDQCFFNQFQCDLINDEEKKEECYSILIERECQGSDMPSLCKALLTDNVEYCGLNEECLMHYAYEIKDETLCEKIDTSFKKSACYAVVNHAWNMCYQMEKYEATQSECLKLYSEITGKGNTICDGLEESRYLYDCLSTVAFHTNNENLCTKILVYSTRRDCYFNLAYEYDRPEVCDLSPEQNDADFCRVRIANKLYSPVICESIMDPSYKWGCFGDSIVKDKTLMSECNKIDGSKYKEWKDLCENIAVDE